MKGILQPAAARGCGRSRAHLRRRADAPRDRWAITKRHFVRRRCKTALCGERCGPSPGLGRDPSSVHPRASAAQLRPGVQPLRGVGSGAVPLRCRTIAVRMRRSCGRLAAAEPPHIALGAARGGDDAAAVRACVRGGLACAAVQRIWVRVCFCLVTRVFLFGHASVCEVASVEISNCFKKRPSAALEQPPDDRTNRFNSQYRLAYSRLGRLQHTVRTSICRIACQIHTRA